MASVKLETLSKSSSSSFWLRDKRFAILPSTDLLCCRSSIMSRTNGRENLYEYKNPCAPLGNWISAITPLGETHRETPSSVEDR